MLIKPDHPSSASAADSSAEPAPKKCGNCGVEERRLLHHVRHSGIYRRLCTNCVLRLHPHCFCPTCFQVYPPNPSNDAILTCCKCFSASHSHCVTAPYPSPYMCPLCANPNTPLFQLKPPSDEHVDISSTEELRVMDRDAAKKLLAAAKIATFSMNKAAGAARLEAEKKAKEAALARKRAREALEHVAFLMVKEKLRKREGALGAPFGGIDVGHVKRENNVKVINSVHRNGVVGGGTGSSVVVEKINAVGNVDRVENSNRVVVALNAVELRENEKINEPTAEYVESGVNVDDDHVSVMDLDVNVDVDVDVDDSCVGVVVGGSVAERNIESGDPVMFAERENGATNHSKQEDINIHQIENGTEHANGTQ